MTETYEKELSCQINIFLCLFYYTTYIDYLNNKFRYLRLNRKITFATIARYACQFIVNLLEKKQIITSFKNIILCDKGVT